MPALRLKKKIVVNLADAILRYSGGENYVTWFPIPFPLVAPSQASPGERHHVHFVGSLPPPTTDQVFTTLCQAFPDSLKRLPDGETGHRQGPVHWQTQVFAQAGLSLYLKDEASLNSAFVETLLPEVSIDPALELDTRYGHYAIASYRTFSQHKDAGTIPKHVKFQVSSPLPETFVVEWVKPEYWELAEAQYEAAIIRAIDTIQRAIPHQELAIQIDCRLLLPGQEARVPTQLLAACAARLAQHVAPDVDLGFHLASSPTGSFRDIVETANAIQRQCSRPNLWLHLSLPPETTEKQYLLALEDLASANLSTETELVLGLVRPREEEESRGRLRQAAERLGRRDFGIAAACNLADLTLEDFEDVLRILKELSTPR